MFTNNRLNFAFAILIIASVLTLKVSSEDRIVGGDVTTIEQFPYQVMVFPGSALCGGALITNTIVITAAHCVYQVPAASIIVVAGATYLTEVGTRRGVKHVAVHPDYNTNIYSADVALLKLLTAVPFGPKIRTILLTEKPVPNDSFVTVTGWGLTQEGAAAPSTQLRVAQVHTMTLAACSQTYKQQITTGMFCASINGKKDTCQGDSGGPVRYNSHLIGITSHGNGCARLNNPGIYTNVYHYLNWINATRKSAAFQ